MIDQNVSSRPRRSNKIVIYNCPPSTSPNDIDLLIKRGGGRVTKIEPSGSENTLSFIYGTPEEAVYASQRISGFELKGVQLKAELGGVPKRRFPVSMNNGNRDAPHEGIRDGSLRLSNEPQLRVLIPSEMVGAIIGRQGSTIRKITQTSQAHIDVLRKEMVVNMGMLKEKLMTISGRTDACAKAVSEILKVIISEGSNSVRPNDLQLKILVGNQYCGRIIGKGGKVLEKMMQESKAKILVSNQAPVEFNYDIGRNPDRVVSVRGDLDSLVSACSLILSKVRQAYERDMAIIALQRNEYHFGAYYSQPCMRGSGGYGDRYDFSNDLMRSSTAVGTNGAFNHTSNQQSNSMRQVETVYLKVPYNVVGAIIGTKGSNIREIKMRSGAQITVATKDEHDAKAHRLVTLVGNPEAQWKAQYCIWECLCYDPHAQVESPVLHVEIMAPKSMVGRIIGRKGSMVKEIQQISGASIKLPDSNSQSEDTTEVPVTIRGNLYQNQCAQRRIRHLLPLPLNPTGTSSGRLTNGSTSTNGGIPRARNVREKQSLSPRFADMNGTH